MKDAQQTIWKVVVIAFALVLVVCVAGSFRYRNAILGGFQLRGAQTRFEDRVRRDLAGDVTIEIRDSSERSAMLVVVPPPAAWESDEARERACDAVWVAYAEEFAGGGMPIDSVVLARRLDPSLESGHVSAVDVLATRTGVPAPPLHPMYAEKGYFDASTEVAPPADDAPTDE